MLRCSNKKRLVLGPWNVNNRDADCAAHRSVASAKMERVLIKKYGNRRLYDTSTSRYVNLVDIAEMIRRGADVSVLDAKSGEDLTRVTLTQIIAEDAKGEQGLPLEFLRQVIVASNKVAHEGFLWFKPALNAVEDFSPLKMMRKLVGGERSELEELKERISELEKTHHKGREGTRKKTKRMDRRGRRGAQRKSS